MVKQKRLNDYTKLLNKQFYFMKFNKFKLRDRFEQLMVLLIILLVIVCVVYGGFVLFLLNFSNQKLN